MSRPSDYSQEIAERICELIGEGKKLEEICAGDEMPAASTVFRWLAAHPEFEKNYGAARRARSHRVEDECIEIADNVAIDSPSAGEGSGRAISYRDIHVAKLRIEVRRWLIRRLAPRRYGRRPVEEPRDAEDVDELNGSIEVKIN